MKTKLFVGILAVGLSGCAIHTTPLTVDEISNYASDKRARVVTDQEPVNGPINLHEAIARALRYNLDSRVELMNIALRQRELHLAHFDVLPDLVASSGYADRNNYSGGSSVTLIGKDETGDESLRSSTSSERDVRT